MDYKAIIKDHRKEVETLQDYFMSEPMSNLEDRIEDEFEKRNGFVYLKRHDTYFKLEGWIYERRYTFDYLIRLKNQNVFCDDLHKLARDLVVADCTEKN